MREGPAGDAGGEMGSGYEANGGEVGIGEVFVGEVATGEHRFSSVSASSPFEVMVTSTPSICKYL